MRQARNTIVTKIIVVATLVLFMVTQHPGVLSSAEAAKATVAVKHKPLKYFVAGHRIQVEAKVTDTQGVTLVRCYFRAAGQADYVFVGMKAGEKDVFTGILPSPSVETKGIEYLFLTVNGKNQVVKTQVFRTELKASTDVPYWQKVGGEGHVALSTELPQATAPAGYTDSITVDVAESSVRFGIVAGIYSATQVAIGGGVAAGGAAAVGGTTGAAAGATSAGTVTASTGLSTTTIVGASAAVVAVAAGVAVASGGADGDGSGSTKSGCDQYAGNWSGTVSPGADTCPNATDPSVDPDVPWSGVFRSDCTATMSISGLSVALTITGDKISGTVLGAGCDDKPEMIDFTATLSGSTLSGTFSGPSGGGPWRGTKQ